jgi:hypothetical protein
MMGLAKAVVSRTLPSEKLKCAWRNVTRRRSYYQGGLPQASHFPTLPTWFYHATGKVR